MRHILVTDELYNQAKKRATNAGFESVDDYVVDMLADYDDLAETPDLDHLFTPERIAHIERISSEVKAGGITYTMEEVDAHLAQVREEWIRKNS